MPRSSFLTASATLLTLTTLAGLADAQTAPPAPPLDLTLLKRALLPLASNTVLQSRSTVQMTGSKQGITFTFREGTHILAKRPGKFRADLIQYAADGSEQRRLLVISDGVKVWTYRPDTHQYSITTTKAFHAANDDMTALGLAQGGFFLGEGHEMAQGLAEVTHENSPQVLTMLAGLGMKITGHSETTDNQSAFLYRLALNKQGIAYRFLIDPATAKLRRIELAGRQNAVNVSFTETITEMEAPATIEKSAFRFVPPPGAAKVSTLSVDPF